MPDSLQKTRQQDSRTARFNVAVSHPPRWRMLLGRLVEPSLRMHRLRNLSAMLIADTMDENDCGARR